MQNDLFQKEVGAVPGVLNILIFNISTVAARQSGIYVLSREFCSLIYSLGWDKANVKYFHL